MEDSSDVNRYYVRLKPNEFIDLEYIEKQENNSIITKEISRTTFKQIIEKVEFYAKIVS